MQSTARLLFLLALATSATEAWADSSASDVQLPCNALCRRWMGLGEAAVPEPTPVAAERQTVETPAPVVASPLPPPPTTRARRPEPPVVRQTPASVAVPRPPARPRREPRTTEARRLPLPAAAPHGTWIAEAPAPRRPATPAAVATAGAAPTTLPLAPEPPPRSAGRAPVEVATAQPVAVAARMPDPAPATHAIRFVLPQLEEPPPPVIVPLPSARADAMPPAFDVIATLLLTTPPRR